MKKTKEGAASPLQQVVMPCYMKATKAFHELGDISRDEEDYCYVKDMTDKGYLGSWCEGLGFFNVLFPYETTRALTEKEQGWVEKQHLVII